MNTNHNETRLQTQGSRSLAAIAPLRELSKEQQQRLVERIFLRLQAYYGTKFNDLWHGIPPEEIKRVWAEALGGFTNEQIADGLRVCLDEPYPPNLPKFLEYCRIKPMNTYRAKELPEMNKEKAQQMVSEIKRRFFADGVTS